MALLSIEELQSLWETHDGLRVSFYAPMVRLGQETTQNRIRVKNLLDDAQERLVEVGMRRPEAKALLEPVEALLPDETFWNHQSDGLALFVSAEDMRIYRLPLTFEPMVTIGERFHIKPLLPLLSSDGRYYVLTLSRHGARLLEGTRDDLAEVRDMPEDLEEALRLDDFPEELQFHTQTASPGGAGAGRPAIFHGHGGGEDETKRLIGQYLSRIDQTLSPLLVDQQAPLVLAGVEYLHPIYREVSSYNHLVRTGIEGSPDDISDAELHAKAWRIVEPLFTVERRQAEERFRQLSGEGHETAISDVAGVVAAARYGRVETLFVATDAQRWGAFDEETLDVVEHDAPQPGDEDLLDLAAIETLRNGGIVYADERARLPGAGDTAALLRY